MSLRDTAKLIEQSRQIVDSTHDDPSNSNSAVLHMILEIVTSINTIMQRMEINVDKRLEGLKQYFLSVSSRVRSLENKVSDFNKKISECETSCQGVSDLFDEMDHRVKCNTRNVIHHDIRIKKLEEKPILQPVVQPVIESEVIRSLREDVLDLKCRSMKNNLIFTGLYRIRDEDTEELLRSFLYKELGIQYDIQFGNVHRFKTRGDNRRAPIVARFIYRRDFEYVLSIAHRLKGKPYGIREQFPAEIEQRRKKLYPVMKEARQQKRQVTLVRDRLYIDNELYNPDEFAEEELVSDNNGASPVNQHTTPKKSPTSESPPYKRSRKGPSPRQQHTGGHSFVNR